MYKPSDAYCKEFTTASPTTGAAANADSLPTATANHNGTDDGSFSLTVTNLDTGRYKITGTVPSGYAKGDVVNVTVAATCSSVAGKACVDTFTIDSKRIGDLNDIAATAIVSGGAITTASGKVSEVALVDTLTTYTGNTVQTADVGVRIGANLVMSAGKVWALDGSGNALAPAGTALSSAVWTAPPTGFLAATFPTTVASPTNITAGTITTTTNLTNAPTAGDFTATMKASLGTAVGIAQTGDSFARIGADGAGLTALGDARIANLDAAVSTRSTYAGGAVASVTAPVALNLAQTGLSPRALDSVSDASLTVGDALVAAICAAAGKESVVSTTYTVETPHTGTAIRTFTLDSSTAPTTRS